MSISKEESIHNKIDIISLLTSTDRDGVSKLVEYLILNGFFEAPASTKRHGAYPGGLAGHSLRVYQLLSQYNIQCNLNVKEDSIIIAALLHDLCKIGAYEKKGNSYIHSASYKAMAHPSELGHSELSIARISKFIKLTELEWKMIQYHMGPYGCCEIDSLKGEYDLIDMIKIWEEHKIVKIMCLCDELATAEGR